MEDFLALRIDLLGRLEIFNGTQSIPINSRKARILLALIALSKDMTISRGQAADLLWPDSSENSARDSLRQALFVIRRALGEQFDEIVRADRSILNLNAEKVDVDIFEPAMRHLEKFKKLAMSQNLSKRGLIDNTLGDNNIDIYTMFRGLDDEYIEKSQRELTDALYEDMARAQKWDVARVLLLFDPSNELAARYLIKDMHNAGRTGAALEEYTKLWNYLDENFGQEPSDETQALIASIKLGDRIDDDPNSGLREPPLPINSARFDVSEKQGRLLPNTSNPPHRIDLESLHSDLRDDAKLFASTGGLSNISAGIDAMVQRFTRIVDRDYDALDQTRLGVQTAALRKRFDGEAEEIKAIDASKHGALDAILMVAELLTSRLPEYQAFLAEVQKDISVVEANAEDVDQALEDATEAMQADPEHFDETLTERLREFWFTKTAEAYLAGVALLNDAAFVVFRSVREFSNDTMTESRKLAVKGLATAFVSSLASVIGKLAGIIPAELEWALPWLKYIPVLFA